MLRLLVKGAKTTFDTVVQSIFPFNILYNRFNYFIDNKIPQFSNKANSVAENVKSAALKTLLLALFILAIVWISIFMYVVFYHAYMPSVTHTKPVHLQFKSCDNVEGICSFPSGHVRLTRMEQLLMVGQKYKISLVLDLPYSERNRNLGMFMCCAELHSRSGALTNHICRSALMPYRSTLHSVLETLLRFPLLYLGIHRDYSIVQVEMFSEYEDDQERPVTDMYVELQSQFIEVNTVTLHIDAHFSGLRYIMFNWPVLSAVIGIGMNLTFIALLLTFSYTTFFSLLGPPEESQVEKNMEFIDDDDDVTSTEIVDQKED